MFVLEACWAQDPPRAVLGLKAHILVQFCNPNVKTPYFVVADRIVVKYSRVVRPYFDNIMSVVEYLPMVCRPWDCINRVKL